MSLQPSETDKICSPRAETARELGHCNHSLLRDWFFNLSRFVLLQGVGWSFPLPLNPVSVPPCSVSRPPPHPRNCHPRTFSQPIPLRVWPGLTRGGKSGGDCGVWEQEGAWGLSWLVLPWGAFFSSAALATLARPFLSGCRAALTVVPEPRGHLSGNLRWGA